MSGFYSASEIAYSEIEARRAFKKNILRFGVDFLDDALYGIKPGDLILLGAPSGVGKTQICCNIALANIEDGKKVHYIALEADYMEIERRMKYPIFASQFFSESNKDKIHMSYTEWLMGEHIDRYWEMEQSAAKLFEGYKDLFVFYKQKKFGLEDLIQAVILNSDKTDLIIVDHIHYFDFDDDNENRAIKKIAMTARDLALNEGRPIILVSHLRKRDRNNDSLVADLDEFHGSSDLHKISTKVVTISSGGPVEGEEGYETFFRIPKNRIDGGVTRYSARLIYSPKLGGYEKTYKLGWAEQSRKKGFEEIAHGLYPRWARRAAKVGGGSNDNVPEQLVLDKLRRRPSPHETNPPVPYKD
jgi:KaiC/GvpD/RAD55 family RecA-like ATPase